MGYSTDKYGKHPSFSLLWPYIIVLGIMLATFFAVPAYAGNNSLYLLQGSPTPNWDEKFPAILYKFADDRTLVKVRLVLDDDLRLQSVREYHDERLVMLKALEYREGYNSSNFYLIDMNSPYIVSSFEVMYPPEQHEIKSYLLNIPGEGLFQLVTSCKGTCKTNGFSLNLMKQLSLNEESIKYSVMSGVPGGGIPSDDFLSVYVNEENKLVIPYGEMRVVSDWELPAKININKNGRVVIFVNNSEMLALSSIKSRVKKIDGLGHTTFHVLNKKNGRWSSLQVQGGNTKARGFGHWLTGYVAGKGRKTVNQKKRKIDMRTTGIPSELRFEMLDEYSPGILFIYNANTKKKYEIETGDADSEVLLVEGDYVYYRVYDEIYKSKIGKDKLEEPELLVEDDAVPDIHWAFFGPKVDVQTGEAQTR